MASLQDACKKNKIINEVDLLKENQDFLKRVMAEMRRKMQTYRRKRKLAAYFRNKNRLCF